MGSKRLFIALDLPTPVREALVGLADPKLAGARWVAAEKLHLTLGFLGNEVPAEGLARLRETLPGAAARVRTFFLPVRGAGSFGNSQPSVLWAGVGNGHPHLFALHKHVQDAVLAAGLDGDLRAFKPHVTLARCERRTRPGAVQHWLRAHAGFDAGLFPVGGFALYRSQLTLTGSSYTREAEFALNR